MVGPGGAEDDVVVVVTGDELGTAACPVVVPALDGNAELCGAEAGPALVAGDD